MVAPNCSSESAYNNSSLVTAAAMTSTLLPFLIKSEAIALIGAIPTPPPIAIMFLPSNELSNPLP